MGWISQLLRLLGDFDVGEGGFGVEGEAGDLDGAVGFGVDEVVFDGEVSVFDRLDESFGLGAFSADGVFQSSGEAGWSFMSYFDADCCFAGVGFRRSGHLSGLRRYLWPSDL